jgi:hypothetical protein
MAVGPFDHLSAVCPWDLAFESGMVGGGLTEIGSITGH